MLDLFVTHLLLGKVKGSGAPAWYWITELAKHVLLLGASGTGKTTLLYWILSQLLGRVGCWVLDRKEDFRHLLRLFPDKLLVFNVSEDFRCNPLEPPPYVKPGRWLEIFVDLFCRSNSLLGGSRAMLLTTLKRLYVQYDVYGDARVFPTFFDLLEALKNLRLSNWGRQAGSRESLVSRLEFYIATNEALYDCSSGFDLESLLSKSVVFELGGLVEVQVTFFINFFLNWIYAYRISKKERGNRLLNLAIFDEAKSVFSPFINNEVGFSAISFMVGMLREFGCGIVPSDQSGHLDNAIWANSALKILYPLGSGDDVGRAARGMGLSPEQAAYMYSLGLGEAIVRYQKTEQVFVLQVPKFPLE